MQNNVFSIMAVGGETSSKILVETYFGLILSIRVPACYLGEVKKFYTNASYVQKNIPPWNWKTVKMTAPAVLVLRASKKAARNKLSEVSYKGDNIHNVTGQ